MIKQFSELELLSVLKTAMERMISYGEVHGLKTIEKIAASSADYASKVEISDVLREWSEETGIPESELVSREELRQRFFGKVMGLVVKDLREEVVELTEIEAWAIVLSGQLAPGKVESGEPKPSQVQGN